MNMTTWKYYRAPSISITRNKTSTINIFIHWNHWNHLFIYNHQSAHIHPHLHLHPKPHIPSLHKPVNPQIVIQSSFQQNDTKANKATDCIFVLMKCAPVCSDILVDLFSEIGVPLFRSPRFLVSQRIKRRKVEKPIIENDRQIFMEIKEVS